MKISGKIFRVSQCRSQEKVKDIEPEQTAEMIHKIANNYKMYASWYKDEE